MINTSNEYKQKIRQNRIFEPRVQITLADTTVLSLTKSDFMENGITISDGVSKSGEFTIGSAIINSLTLVLNNFNGKFNTYDFEGAVIRPEIGLNLSASTEYLPKGVFTVDNATTAGSTIIVTAYDNMIKLDRPFSEVSVSYPITALALLQAICTHCSVPLLTTTFTNSSFSITRAIDDEATTCREVLIYIAQLAGCFARCNKDGYLELKWFDMSVIDSEFISAGTFTEPSADEISAGTFTNPATDIIQAGEFTDLAKFHTFYSLGSMSVATDDILITGVQVKAMGTDTDYGETVLFGTTGYILSIEDNPLIIEGKGSTIANSVGAKIVGMRFRPCEFTTMSDPSVEAGDVGYLIDRKTNNYQILVSNTKLKVGTRQSISCDAETPTKRQSGRTDPATKVIIEARKNTQQQLTTYDLMMQQITATVANGMGLYQIIEGDDYSGRIYYNTDKPTMAESTKRWFYTTGGYVQQTRPTISDEWVTTSGADVYGNALYNTITTRGINAEWIHTRNFLAEDNFDNTTFSIDENGLVHIFADEFSLQGKSIAENVNSGNINLLKNTAYNPLLPTAFSTRNSTATVNSEGNTFNDINTIRYISTLAGSYGVRDFSQTIDGKLEVGKNIMLSLYVKSSSFNAVGHARIEGANTSTQEVIFNVVNRTTWGDRKVLDFGTVLTSGSYGSVKVTIWFDVADTYDFGQLMLAYGNTIGEWQPAITDVNENAIAQADAVMTQTNVFNTLTNNGAIQGLFMKNGQLYVNMSYLQSGIIKVGGVNNGNGLLQVYDNSGNLITTLDKGGLTTSSANITGGSINIQSSDASLSIIKLSSTVNGYTTISEICPSYIKVSDSDGNIGIYDSNNMRVTNYNGTFSIQESAGAVWQDENSEMKANIGFDGSAFVQNLSVVSAPTGSFVSADGKIVNVTKGIITNISVG